MARALGGTTPGAAAAATRARSVEPPLRPGREQVPGRLLVPLGHGAHQRAVGGVGRQVPLAAGDGEEERQGEGGEARRGEEALHRDSRGRVRRSRHTGWPVAR